MCIRDSLLDTLNVFNRIAPPYSSAVLVELRKKEDDYFVSVSRCADFSKIDFDFTPTRKFGNCP